MLTHRDIVIPRVMKNIIDSNPLFFVFAVPVVVDVIGTVLGQPPAYWQSGHKIFREAVPVYPLLQIHPVLFIVFCLGVWLSFTYFLTKKLKEPLNIWATTSLLIGHGYNSVTWFRIILYQAGIFAGSDQFSQALSLIPMSLYILGIGFIAMKAFLLYFKKMRLKL